MVFFLNFHVWFLESLKVKKNTNTTKTAWTRLYNLAGTEWELPEDDVLALKHVGAINKEQYNKTVNQVCICVFITHTVKDARYKG